MAGDQLKTDMKMRIDAGMATGLVLTRDANREKLAVSDLRATFVLEHIDRLL
jgi:ribonucleotide monophosphatase NagD (HAD superfamily)